MTHRPTLARVAAFAAFAVVIASCSSDGTESVNSESPTTTETTDAPSTTEAETPTTAPALPADADQLVDDVAAAVAERPECDWLDTGDCLFPFPSNLYEAPDDTTETGIRLDIAAAALPTNTEGVAVDPALFSRNDGWGVGTPIVFAAADLDLDASALATPQDIAASLDDASGSVLLDLTTGERLAHWVDLDERPTTPQDERTMVTIRPAAVLPAGHHIAIGLRELIDTDGDPIPSSAGFRVVRDAIPTDIDEIEQRRAQLDTTIDALDADGLPRPQQWLAWDFVVMSTENVTGDVLSMRDQAFDALGDGAPGFTVTSARTQQDDGSPLPDGVGVWINGTFEVPSYLTGDGEPGATLTRDDAGVPASAATFDAKFACALTERQLAGEQPARPVVYGHGLLGNYEEVLRGDLGAAADDLMYCATPWIGMSDDDLGYAAGSLADINAFPAVADRLRQGMVNQLFLARLIRHPDGLATAPELATANGNSAIDPTEVFYEGHSQGGIMGFATTAISTEWTKAVIGVPGVNFSLLIPRSSNWERFGPVIESGYPGPIPSFMTLALLQQMWDRAEGSGYVRHLTSDPLPGTPEHQVLIQVALGDHQVSEHAAYLAARTAGVPVRTPAFDDGRTLLSNPPYGLDQLEPGAVSDSAVVIWDSGAMPSPVGTVSPDASPEWAESCPQAGTAFCGDPHEDPRRDPASHDQRTEFFTTGKIVDVCGDGACLAASTAT